VAVSALSPDEERGSVQSHLLALVRKDLVRPELPGPQMEDRFSFRHVLVRDAAYGVIPKTQKAMLHERLGDWFERTLGQGYEEILGYHLEQAFRAHTDLRPEDEHARELAERASQALATAGRRASARDDVPAALNLLGRAATLLPARSLERGTLTLELASRLHQAGHFDEVESVLDEAETTAALVGDRTLELRILVERGFLETARAPEGRGGMDRQIAESVIPELEGLGDDVGLAKAWWLLSEEHGFACRWEARAEALERALEHARRAGDRRQYATLVGLLGQALLYGPTHVDSAIFRCEGFLDEARNDRTVEAGTLSVLAVLRAMQGEFDEARRLWSAAAEIYEDLGLRYRRAARSLLPATIELLADDPNAAVAELRDGYQTLAAMGERGVRSTLAAFLADALCTAGRYAEAEEFARVSAELAASDDLVSQIMWRCAQTIVLVQRGDLERAETLALEAERLAAQTDSADLLPAALLSRAEALRASRRLEEGVRLIERAESLYGRKGNVVAARKAASLLVSYRT
jgi:tetratricopeptide (TPR) repeat protein